MDKEVFEREYKIHKDIADGVYAAETTKVTSSDGNSDGGMNVDVESTYKVRNPDSGVEYIYTLFEIIRVAPDGNRCRNWYSIEKR